MFSFSDILCEAMKWLYNTVSSHISQLCEHTIHGAYKSGIRLIFTVEVEPAIYYFAVLSLKNKTLLNCTYFILSGVVARKCCLPALLLLQQYVAWVAPNGTLATLTAAGYWCRNRLLVKQSKFVLSLVLPALVCGLWDHLDSCYIFQTLFFIIFIDWCFE